MLNLNRKTDYALIALAYLGQRREAGLDAVSARKISSEFGLPMPLMMNILKELAAGKLVASTRGAAGGYHLARPADEITLLEVITITDGPLQLTPCAQGLPIVGQGCPIAADCRIKEPIRRLHQRLEDLFAQMTVADLIESSTLPIGESQEALVSAT